MSAKQLHLAVSLKIYLFFMYFDITSSPTLIGKIEYLALKLFFACLF
jgi:hypothetical protein